MLASFVILHFTCPEVLLVHAHSNGCDIGDMRQTLQSISESLKVHVPPARFGPSLDGLQLISHVS